MYTFLPSKVKVYHPALRVSVSAQRTAPGRRTPVSTTRTDSDRQKMDYTVEQFSVFIK